MRIPSNVGWKGGLRQEARASKNFALADSIRKGLTEIGITLEDRPGGTEWRRGA